jgi:ketosteroid isomerase-like protein
MIASVDGRQAICAAFFTFFAVVSGGRTVAQETTGTPASPAAPSTFGGVAHGEVAEVVALDEQLRTALWERDFEVVEQLYAPEFTLNSPANRIQSRKETIDLLRNSDMRQTGVSRNIEAAYPSGPDVVVIMGYESLVWEGTGSDLDGRRTARRFTNIWRRIDGQWRSIGRQATSVPVAGAVRAP